MNSLESLTATLRRAGIDPDGYGNRIGESLEDFTKRLASTGAEPEPNLLDFIPVQNGIRETI